MSQSLRRDEKSKNIFLPPITTVLGASSKNLTKNVLVPCHVGKEMINELIFVCACMKKEKKSLWEK